MLQRQAAQIAPRIRSSVAPPSFAALESGPAERRQRAVRSPPRRDWQRKARRDRTAAARRPTRRAPGIRSSDHAAGRAIRGAPSLSNPWHRLEQPARVVEPHREVIAAQPPCNRGTHRRGRHVLQSPRTSIRFSSKLRPLRQPQRRSGANSQQRERNANAASRFISCARSLQRPFALAAWPATESAAQGLHS